MNPILREAVSSPYIGSQLESISTQNVTNNTDKTIKLHSAVSDERFEKLRDMANSVQFQTGSSSSTDLHFYTESKGNGDILEQWAKLHEEQRQRQQESTKIESADNLRETNKKSEQGSVPDIGESEPLAEGSILGKYRSETNLPGKARDSGFHLLEKCCSVELNPAANIFTHSRLTRTKEMPDITDVEAEDEHVFCTNN